jgi:tripartite-type tricarboxylate transporter receptor subunit TctC
MIRFAKAVARSVAPALLTLAIAAAPAAAQDYPFRTITVVVPLPAGGTADILARIAADKIRTGLNAQVVVENRPGGVGGLVGTEAVWRAAPDGYTLLVAPQLTFSVSHLLFPKMNFDTRTFEPVSVIARYPVVLLGKPDLPFNTLAELVAFAKANPGKINYASQGKGQTGHLTMEMINHLGGIQTTQVPYRGSAPAITDLLASQVDVLADYLLATKASVEGGKLKLLATGSRERLPEFPNVPTMNEVLPGAFADTWMGMVAPPGTPAEITKKISDAIGAGMKDKETSDRIKGLMADPIASPPAQMRDLIRQSAEQWSPVITTAKITVE